MSSGGSIRQRTLLAFLAFLAMALAMQVVATPRAWAGHTVTVRVVIEHVLEQGCTDNLDGSDFYARIVIAGQAFDFGPVDNEDEISPNWVAEQPIAVETASSASVVIMLADSDGFLNFGDDICDIEAGSGTNLDLTVMLNPCSVSGEVSGSCGTPLTTSGNGEADGDAELRFRVEVDVPPEVPGWAVRCTHSPLWPQPGDDVTITVESLDGTVQVGDTMVDLSSGPPGPPLVDHKKIADHLEIWVTEETAPDLDVANKSSDSFVVHDLPAGDLVYECVVKDGTEVRSTGWRRTRVGPPSEGTAIPVIYTGDRADRVDVVLIADQDSYTAATDAAFLANAGDVIKGAYYGQDYFLANQQWINFWLADQMGDAERVAAPTPSDPTHTDCVLTLPPNWATDYSWRDVGAILHTDIFRDCANAGVYSAEPTSLGTALHETGHAPFGLADEYCCDGGYYENPPYPNMFDTLAECQADAPSLGRTGADCRTVTDTRPTPAESWFLSEPEPNDLMNSDRRPPQAADIRRMDWYLGNCDAGLC